ncbi:uncharacterized protein J3R85_014356 [Psidium guajava]|nr:uncharacterized protein J3R85_014356 [Psidium guajava]
MINEGEGGDLVEEWVELANGCVCCTVKHSLVQALEAIEQLVQRKESSVDPLSPSLSLSLSHTHTHTLFTCFPHFYHRLEMYCFLCTQIFWRFFSLYVLSKCWNEHVVLWRK